MTVDETLLTKLEKLSNLKVADAKRPEMIEQLQSILSFVENLSELKTQNEETKFLMERDIHTTLRKDEIVKSTIVADDILSHAPRSEDHAFVVPKIIE